MKKSERRPLAERLAKSLEETLECARGEKELRGTTVGSDRLIARFVNQALVERYGAAADGAVETARMRKEEDLWWVPVGFRPTDVDRLAYYLELSEIEENVERATREHVMLLPTHP